MNCNTLKVLLLCSAFLLCKHTISAQESKVISVCEKGNAEYQIRYDKVMVMFDERHNSQIYQDYLALRNALDEKANFEGNRWDIIRKQEKGLHGVHEWVPNNIEKTDFNNCEEAQAEIDKLVQLRDKIFRENMDLFMYYEEATRICEGLLLRLMLELNEKYGRNFEPF